MASQLMDAAEIAEHLLAGFNAASNARPRNQQITIGPSAIGGCREFLRATIAGDPQLPDVDRGVDAAEVGTMLGDEIEARFAKWIPGIQTQVSVLAKLPLLDDLEIGGHADLVHPEWDMVLDLKSKFGLVEIDREGPSVQNLVQVSTYCMGLIQQGTLSPTARAALVYYDRSGQDRDFLVEVVEHNQVEKWFAWGQQNLAQVFEVLDAGSPEEQRWGLRDQSPSTCHFFHCPFRDACWTGSAWREDRTLNDEAQIRIVQDYVTGREIEKNGAKLKQLAKGKILEQEIFGFAGDFVVSTTETSGGNMRVDVMPR